MVGVVGSSPIAPTNSKPLQTFALQGFFVVQLLQRLVAAVAQGAGLGLLAAAEIHGFGFRGFVLLRRERPAFVRAVAKGLVLALTARTPPVAFASFYVDGIRGFLWHVGLCHGKSPGVVDETLRLPMLSNLILVSL